MRMLTPVLLASTLLVAGASAWADTKDDVKNGTEHAAKTAAHGTTAAGKEASRLYHTTASGVHKVIAHNTRDPDKKAAHLQKADVHAGHARRKTQQTKQEL